MPNDESIPAQPTAASTDQAQLSEVRAERDAAVAALKKTQARRGGRLRRVSVGLLVVIFAILLPVTVVTTWVHRTVLNTDAYINTVAPIASDPAVTAAVSREVTDQLYATLDPQAVVAQALPPKAAFLAGPIANGARSYVQNAVDKVLQSDQFQTLWKEANRNAHAQLVAVLRGHLRALDVTNGQVVINLVPALNGALQNMQEFASSVVGKQITLPTVSSSDVPAVACQKIADALGRPLPSTCAQIPLFSAKKLTQAQRFVRAFDRGVIALLILTPLIALGALLLSRRRRRTLLQLSIAGIFGLVIVRRTNIWFEHTLVSAGKPENRDARAAILDHALNSFYSSTKWILVGLLVVVAIALITGPYRFAVTIRGWFAAGWRGTVSLARTGVSATSTASKSDSTVAWVRSHYDPLRVGGYVVAILLTLIFGLSFWGILITLGLLVVYELWLHRLRPPETVVLPDSQQAPTPVPKPSVRS